MSQTRNIKLPKPCKYHGKWNQWKWKWNKASNQMMRVEKPFCAYCELRHKIQSYLYATAGITPEKMLLYAIFDEKNRYIRRGKRKNFLTSRRRSV